jgi:iron complex outermembrane receptor protein
MSARSTLIAALILGKALSLHAAEGTAKTELSEEDYLGNMPTVLTVSRLSQPLDESPSAVTVIDRETIQASGVADLTDIFRLIPGMYVGHNAGYFHTVNPTVSYHGLADAYSRRMQVLVDGRSVYAPMHGGVQWSDIPLAIEDIARIEVTRGPNSASHGANAFLGVINIITQHSSETLGNTAVLTRGGDRKGITYRHGGKSGDLQYRITASLKDDEGTQQREDEKRIGMLNIRADYRLNDRDELEFQFGFNGGDRREGLLEEDPFVFLPRTKEVYSHFEQFNWRRTLGPDSEFKLQAYHSRDLSDDHVISADLTPIFGGILLNPRLSFDHDVMTERYDLEAQHTFAPTASTRLVWGGSVRLDRARSKLFLGTDDTESFRLSRLFGHLEWVPHPRLILNGGAMLEHNSLTGADLTPRASVNFKLAPGHTLRAGISTATRTPTLLEEKFNMRILIPTTIPGTTLFEQQFLDPGGLSPERITSRELGYQGNFGPLSLDGRLFHDQIRDLVSQFKIEPFPFPAGLVPIEPDTIGYRNSSDLTIHGFEAQAQLRLGSHTRVIGNYSHIRINPDMDAHFTGSGEARRFAELAEAMPINSFSLLAWHRFGQGWMGTIGYYQSGEAEMPGDGNHVEFSRHWDARIARTFNLGKVRSELSVTSQNVFDQDYQEFARYNTLGRRTYLQYRMDF